MSIWKSVGKIGLARIINAVSSFAALVIFARVLDSHEIGVFFLFLAIVGVAHLLVDCGFSGAVEKRISEGMSEGDILATVAIPKLGLYLLFVFFAFVLQHPINQYVGHEVLYPLIITVIAKDIFTVFKRVINGQLRVAMTAPLIASEQLGWLVLGLGGLLLMKNVIVLIYSYMITMILLSFWSIYISQISWGNRSLVNLRSLVSYAKFEIVSEAGWRVYNWTDVLVIGIFLSQSYVGGYEIAWRLAGVTVLVGHAARTSFFPVVSSWNSSSEMKKIQKTVEQMLAVSLFLVFPAFVGTIVLSENILSIIYGPEYAFAGIAFVILVGQKIAQGTDQVIGYSLRAIDRPKITAFATIIGATSNIILNVILVPNYGITGAAMSTLISYTIMVIIKWYFAYHLIGVTSPRIIGWFISSSVVMAIILQTYKSIIKMDTIIGLASALFVAILTYGVLMTLHSDLRRSILRLLRHP